MSKNTLISSPYLKIGSCHIKTRTLSFEDQSIWPHLHHAPVWQQWNGFTVTSTTLTPYPQSPHHSVQFRHWDCCQLPFITVLMWLFFLMLSPLPYLCCLSSRHLNSGNSLEMMTGIIRNSSQIIGLGTYWEVGVETHIREKKVWGLDHQIIILASEMSGAKGTPQNIVNI